MKKVIIIAGIIALFMSACTNLKKTTYNDDVYVDPKEEKLERDRLALEKKNKEEQEAKKQAEELAAKKAEQKAKDDNNPAYKEPVYDKDDYYDYQYASRLRRFNNPVYGLGYYDNYYTNYYWYNGNPAYYGASIYNSYNWWGPSYSCGPNFGFGMSYNYGYGNSYYGYNPYGYNPYYGYNNGYWQGFYSGYNHGYYNGYNGYPYSMGYNSPYYGGWGYYNSYDANSGYNKSTYAPRTSHDGGNSGRVSNPGTNANIDGYSAQYIQGVINQQENTPKFDAKATPVKPIKSIDHSGNVSPIDPSVKPSEPRINPYGNNPVSNPNNNNPKGGINEGTDIQLNNPPPIKTNPGKNTIETQPVKPIKTENPKGNLFESGNQPNFKGGNNNPAPSGGNSPRSGGNSDGGTKRPR